MNDSRRRAKNYSRLRYLAGLSELALTVAFLVLIITTGYSVKFAGFALYSGGNFYLSLTLYIVILSLIYYVLLFPLTFYAGFILDHKFSLSGQSLFSWCKDEFKKIIISLTIFLVLVNTFYLIARNFQSIWWLACFAAWIIFSVLFARIFPVVIIPLFYKYNPLRDKELNQRIKETARKFGISVLDVFEIDFSAKTRKSNAAVVGWGPTRRVILADNLVREFTHEEVEVVVAHEMAHHRLNHFWKLILASSVSIFIFFFITGRLMNSMGYLPGSDALSDLRLFPSLWLLFVIYGFAVTPFTNAISRRFEREADTRALEVTGSKDAFITMMTRLAEKNLADDDPGRVIEILFYTHPPISRRIEMAKKFDGKK